MSSLYDETEEYDDEETPEMDFEFDLTDEEKLGFDFKIPSPNASNSKEQKLIPVIRQHCYFCNKRPEIILNSGHPVCVKCKIMYVDNENQSL